jgi:hypothetical protein
MNSSSIEAPATRAGALLSGVVVDTVDDGARLVVALPDGTRTTGEPVTAETRAARPGDRVLLMGDAEGRRYAVGRLGVAPATTLTLDRGAFAAAPDGSGGDRLQVFNERRELLFEYDARRGTLRLSAGAGDIELLAPRGAIRLRASAIDAAAENAVRLDILDSRGRSSSSVGLLPDRLTLAAGSLGIVADRCRLVSEQTECKSASVRVEAGEADVAVGSIRTAARVITTTARDVCQRVERLASLAAGRVRTMVKGTHHVRADRAVIHAKGDVDIDGREVRLG